MYPSITGIPNNKYDVNFLTWLFDILGKNNVNRVVQVGCDNGYLSSLLLARMEFSDFAYLGIARRSEISNVLKEYLQNFHFCDDVRNVEGISKAALFTVLSNSPVLMICEISDAFVMYNALLRPGDVMVTTAKRGGQDIVSVPGWELHIK